MAAPAINPPRSQRFRAGDLFLEAKRWGQEGARPVIAVHGWLDNCASFDFLAPLLTDCDLVCLDCAGHGLSDHRSHLGAYNIWQDIADIFAVADQLGWREFSLIGHSRGAMIAFLAAGTFPQRIHQLILIEGAGPRTANPEDAAANLADSIRHLNACVQRPANIYSDYVSAVAAREFGTFPIAHEDALALAERGVASVGDGFCWHYDRKLMAGSEIKLSSVQVESFYQRLTAPCLLIVAEQGLLVNDPLHQRWLEDRKTWTIAALPGGHHLHMSQHCSEVAQLIQAHWAEADLNSVSTSAATKIPHV